MADIELYDASTYDFVKLSAPIITIATNYPVDVDTVVGQEVQVRLQTPTRRAGVYSFGMSTTATFGTANDRISFRFSLDGGSSWDEFTAEAKDTLEVRPFEYTFPKVIVSDEAFDLVMQAKSDVGDNDINFMDAWIMRVG